MAILDVTEYESLGTDAQGRPLPTGKEPAVATQQVAIGVTSAAVATAFDDKTRFVRLHADAACRFKFGDPNPTAAATSPRLGANGTEYFAVNPGDKVACIQSA